MKYLFIFIWCLCIGFSSKTYAQNSYEKLRQIERLHLLAQTDSIKKLCTPSPNDDEYIGLRKKYFLSHVQLRTQPDSAIKQINLLEKVFANQKDQKYMAFSTASKGVYYRRIGRFEDAIAAHQKAIDFCKKHYTGTNDKQQFWIIAAQHNSIAINYFDRSDFEKCNNELLVALKLASTYNIPHIDAAASLVLGNLQMHYKQLSLANQTFLKTYKLAQKLNDKTKEGIALSNLGIVNLLKIEANNKDGEAYQLAKKYLNIALNKAIADQDFGAISARYSNLANAENAVKNYENALKYLENAKLYAEKSKNKVLLLQLTTSVARTYMGMGKLAEAIKVAENGLTMADELGNQKEKPLLNEILHQAYTKEKDFEKALKYKEAQLVSKDSVYKISTANKLSELQTQYETEKKQKEIELLKANNQLVSAKVKQKNYLLIAIFSILISTITAFYFWYKQYQIRNQQKQAEMKQRLLRAQLNPHFLFNCLNSIQRLYVEGNLTKANDFLADFAQLMRDILDKTGKTKIPLYEELDFIESYLSLEKRRLGNKFNYTITIDEDLRNSEVEVPSFIIQPLAENALMHGILPKKQLGTINITAQIIPQNILQITVEDDGVGLNYNKNTFKTHTSKAMELIRSRLGKTGKLIAEEVKAAEDHVLGTKITIQLYAENDNYR